MKYCPNCGNPAEDNTFFCKKCGTSFVTASPAVTPFEGFNPVYAEPAPKKKSPLKPVLISLAAVLLVAAVAIFFIVFNNPKHKVIKAFENNIEDLFAITENCDTLNEAIETSVDLIESGEYSGYLRVQDNYYDSIDLTASLDYSKDDELLRLESSGEFSDGWDYYPLDFVITSDEERTVITSDTYLDGAYGFMNEGFGDQLISSDLYRETGLADTDLGVMLCGIDDVDFFEDDARSFEDYIDSHEDIWDDFKDSISVEKCSRPIKYAYDADTYCVSFGTREFIELCKSYADYCMVEFPDYYYEELEEAAVDMQIYVAVESRHVAAIEFVVDNESLIIAFSGDENVMTNVRVYCYDETVFTFMATITENGFVANAWLYDDKYDAVTISCDDSRRTISVECGDEELFDLTYDCDKDRAVFSSDIDDVGKFNLTISELEDPPKVATGSMEDILRLDEDELYDIIDYIADVIYTS